MHHHFPPTRGNPMQCMRRPDWDTQTRLAMGMQAWLHPGIESTMTHIARSSPIASTVLSPRLCTATLHVQLHCGALPPWVAPPGSRANPWPWWCAWQAQARSPASVRYDGRWAPAPTPQAPSAPWATATATRSPHPWRPPRPHGWCPAGMRCVPSTSPVEALWHLTVPPS